VIAVAVAAAAVVAVAVAVVVVAVAVAAVAVAFAAAVVSLQVGGLEWECQLLADNNCRWKLCAGMGLDAAAVDDVDAAEVVAGSGDYSVVGYYKHFDRTVWCRG